MERTFEILARQEMPRGCEKRVLIFSETRSVCLLPTFSRRGCTRVLLPGVASSWTTKPKVRSWGSNTHALPAGCAPGCFGVSWRVGGAGGVLAGALSQGAVLRVAGGRHLELRVAAGLLPTEPSGAGAGGRVAPGALV